MLNRITFEENPERLKVVIPLERIWPYWIVYSLLLLIWVIASAVGVVFLFRTILSGNLGFEGLFLFAWFVIVIVIAAIWWWLGRKIWRYWQYYSADREILFFYNGRLVVRRPLSLLGITDAYDWKFISPFKFDEKIQSATFDYGSHRIPVGITLPPAESHALIKHLNGRFFPDYHQELDQENF